MKHQNWTLDFFGLRRTSAVLPESAELYQIWSLCDHQLRRCI